MAVLNDWQKITRVLPGKPFGDGSDGAYSSATIPTLVVDSCSGSAGSTTLTTSGSTFANGDLLLIHQSRGTGVGQWEINRVSSGGGTTTLTLQEALQYTYTDSGASQSQAIKIFQYTTVTVETGTWTISNWAGNTGGVFCLAANSEMTVTGTLTGTGKGMVGGYSHSALDNNGVQGEGLVGAGGAYTPANGDGGGGGGTGSSTGGGGGGGGGGHAVSGSNGNNADSGAIGGTGGGTSGTADNLTLTFGGAGGSGGADDNFSGSCGAGGNSGAIIALFVKNLAITGGIANNGNAGGNATGNGWGGGGGGSGGSFLVACATATLGSNLVTATGGPGGLRTGNAGNGGAGAVGRIAIHHSGAVTGTTNPTFTDVTDDTLIESASDNAIFFASNF